ncbi:MAG TPA: hypothetical protein VK031_08845 [Tissierellaceae bacterium]|nr:hypothetical protein [Tissierellaceae bacterium]
MKKYEDKLKAHPVVRDLIEVAKKHNTRSAYLTGGAVVDILDGREPKDYDISWIACQNIHETLGKHKYFKLIYSSRTSTTYLFKEKYKVQILKTHERDFPFMNDRILFNLRGELEIRDNPYLLSILKERIIVVNDEMFERGGISRKLFKARVKKWESKGYKMHPITYKSYIRMTKHKSIFRRFVEVFTGSKSETES